MIEIRNCDFKFQCPKTWDSLSATHKPDVKHCDHCHEEVHFCHTPIELQEAILNNYCVAVVSTVEAADETKEIVLLGDIDPSFFKQRRRSRNA